MKYGLRKEGKSPDSKQEWKHSMENNLTFLKVEILFLKQQLQESNRRIEKLEGNSYASFVSSGCGKSKDLEVSRRGKSFNFQNQICQLPVAREFPPGKSLFSRPSWWQYPTCGTRSTPYQPSCSRDLTSIKPGFMRVNCITAMPQYKDQSLEELRYQDYVARDGLNTHQLGVPGITGRNNVFGDTNQSFGPSTNPGVEYQLFGPPTSGFFGPKKFGDQPFMPSSTTTGVNGSYKFGEYPFGPSSITTSVNGTNKSVGHQMLFGSSSTTTGVNGSNKFGNQPFGPSSTSTGVNGPHTFGYQPFIPSFTTTGVNGSNKSGDHPFGASSTTTGVIGSYTFGYQPFGQCFGPSSATTGVIGSNKFGDQPFGQCFGPSTTTGVIGSNKFGDQPFGQCFGPSSITTGVIGSNKLYDQAFGPPSGSSRITPGLIGCNKFVDQPFGQNVCSSSTSTGVIGPNKFSDRPFGSLFNNSSPIAPHATGSFRFGYQPSVPLFSGPSVAAPSVIGSHCFGSTTTSSGFSCTNNQTQNTNDKGNDKTVPNKPKPLECEFDFKEEDQQLKKADELVDPAVHNKEDKELCSNSEKDSPKPVEYEFGYKENNQRPENAETLLPDGLAMQITNNHKNSTQICDKHTSSLGYTDDCNPKVQKEMLSEVLTKLDVMEGYFHNVNGSLTSVDHHLADMRSCVSIMDSRLSAIDMFLTMQKFDKKWRGLEPSLESLDVTPVQNRKDPSDMECTENSKLIIGNMSVSSTSSDPIFNSSESSSEEESAKSGPTKSGSKPDQQNWGTPNVDSLANVNGKKESILAESSARNEQENAVASTEDQESPNRAGNEPRTVERQENDKTKMDQETSVSIMCNKGQEGPKLSESLTEIKIMNVKESIVEGTAENLETLSENLCNIKSTSVSNCNKIRNSPNKLENVIFVANEAGILNIEENKYDTDDEFVVIEKSDLNETDQQSQGSEQCSGPSHSKLCNNVTQYMEVHFGKNPVGGFKFEATPGSPASESLEVSVSDNTLHQGTSFTDNSVKEDSFSTFIDNLICSRSGKQSSPYPSAEKYPEYQKSIFKSKESSCLFFSREN